MALGTHIVCTRARYTPHDTRVSVFRVLRSYHVEGLRRNGGGIPMTAVVAREARRVARHATERRSEIRSRFSRRECRSVIGTLSSLSQFLLLSSRFRRSACSSRRLRRCHDYSVTRRTEPREQKYRAHALSFFPLATPARDEGGDTQGTPSRHKGRSATRRDATSRLRGLPLPRHFSLQFSRSRV